MIWHPCHGWATTVHVAVNGEYAGHIVISDELKPDAAEAVASLKRAGVRKTVMLTGDAKAVGESVAKELGIDEVHAGLLPGDKVDQGRSAAPGEIRERQAGLCGRRHQRRPSALRAGYRHRHGRWAPTRL